MTTLRARIFDGALNSLITTPWTSGTIKARFTNDQAFDRTAAVSAYTGVLGADVTLASTAINVDTVNNFAALSCATILSNVPGGSGSDVDAVIIYRSASTDVPLFYLACSNVNIGAANTGSIVIPTTGLFQFHGSTPALMKKYLQGSYDLTNLPSSLTAFTVDTQPTATTVNDLTPTSNLKTVGFDFQTENSSWMGGTFQLRLRCSSFSLNVNAGVMQGLVLGDTDANLMYAYIPLVRNLETATKVNFNIPPQGLFCFGGF